MEYKTLIEGIFIKRPNRFIAQIKINGKIEECHVKNTGRLKELLLPGTLVLVEPADNPARKTKYSLICVKKEDQWVNIDSQVVNQIAAEWIAEGNFLPGATLIKREKTYGNSRFDLYVEVGEEKWYIEVKGVTLEKEQRALFPDAPTLRGVKHIHELIKCHEEGYHTAVLFVIQRKGIREFMPNEERHPEFAGALRQAQKKGVKILAVDCIVDDRGIIVDSMVPVKLY